jgi:hypothetical protein
MVKLKRTELSKRYNISNNDWARRHDDLIEYLNQFMNIKEENENGRYYYIIEAEESELPEFIPKIPRKINKQERYDDYENFTIKALGTELKPNSKAKIAREAIEDFGRKKYNHNSQKYVAKEYISPFVEKHGEHTDYMIWVDCETYFPLDDDQLTFLRETFKNQNLTEKKMAEAFVKIQEGEDVTEEEAAYKKVINLFRDKYAFYPIKVYKWKVKSI